MPDRRAFLEAAALVATTPTAAVTSADGAPATTECAICGEEKHAVEWTTVDPIAPLEADICAVCQFVQNHALPDDVCMECGDPVESGFYIELEYPLGEADLPARTAGTLCGDCSAWIASDIAYRGVQADPGAKERFHELIDAETNREGSA